MRSQRKALAATPIDQEFIARAQILRGYPSFVATWVPGPTGAILSTKLVHAWWQRKLIFAFRHQFEREAPKPLMGRLLRLLQPDVRTTFR
jgi:hypothetical protein